MNRDKSNLNGEQHQQLLQTPPITPDRKIVRDNEAAGSIEGRKQLRMLPVLNAGKDQQTTVQPTLLLPREQMSRPWVMVAIAYSAISVLYWSWVTFQFSNESNPNYIKYEERLQPGWMRWPGSGGKIMMDNSDSQYSGFRNNMPTLVLVMLCHQALQYIVSAVICANPPTSNRRPSTSYQYLGSTIVTASSSSTRKAFTLTFSLIFLSALFGSSILKILVIVLTNFGIAKLSPKKHWVGPVLSWIFSIGILFLNDAYQGYKFGSLYHNLAWLDEYDGIGLRWQITFNFTVLRMISFSMDYYWACYDSNNILFQNHFFKCKECDDSTGRLCETARIQKSQHILDYSLINYLTYLTYAPLYMAGPIISFNNFNDQMQRRPKSITLKGTITYGLRWIGAVLLMELMMHLFHVVAIKDAKAWAGFSSLQIFTLGYFNLNFIWIKLLIIWRFFRLWAMADGIETQENMTTCMSNNYSGIEFWRGWHASYNKWLIRYIYIPLGGSSRRIINSLIIFTFVGLWHDIQLKLLAWGWLIVLFILPEVLCTSQFCTPQMRKLFGDWHLQICAFGGLLSIWMMMIANLIGFAVGLDGILEMGSQLLQWNGIVFILFASSTLFAFVHIQFAVKVSKAKKRDLIKKTR